MSHLNIISQTAEITNGLTQVLISYGLDASHTKDCAYFSRVWNSGYQPVACGPWGTAQILQDGREFNPRVLKMYITFAAILAPPATALVRVLLLLLLLKCKFNSNFLTLWYLSLPIFSTKQPKTTTTAIWGAGQFLQLKKGSSWPNVWASLV